MKNRNKFLAMLLAVIMVLSMATMAFADGEPDGEAADTSGHTAGVIKSTEMVSVKLNWMGFQGTGHTYNAIKLFDLYKVVEADGTTQVVDSNGNHIYQYRFVSVFTDAMKTSLQSALNAGGFKIDMNTCAITKLDDSEIETKVGQNENSSDAAKLASILAKFAAEHIDVYEGTEMFESLTLNRSYKSLNDGYWVVYEASNTANDGTVATKPILLNLNKIEQGGQRNIALKDSKVNIRKVIVAETPELSEINDYAIGDVINYKIFTNFPVYQADSADTFTEAIFEITDTLSTGLTLDTTPANIIVKIAEEKGEPQTIEKTDAINSENVENETYKVTASANSLKIEFDNDFIMDHQGYDIIVFYKAALNQNAVYNDEDGNPNTAQVKYSNNPMSTSDYKTLEDGTITYTYAFDLRKLDGVDDSHLAGAVFELKEGNTVITFSMGANGEYIVDPNGTVTEITTVGTGDVTIIGLDEGTYTLHEKSAPAGYSLLAQDVVVVINAMISTGNNNGGGSDDDEPVEFGEFGDGGRNSIQLPGQAEIMGGQAAEAGNGDDDHGASSEADNTAEGLKTGAATISVTNGTVITDTQGDTEGASKVTGVEGNSDVNVIVRNYRGINLPETGSVSAIVIGISGLIAVLGGGAFIARKKND